MFDLADYDKISMADACGLKLHKKTTKVHFLVNSQADPNQFIPIEGVDKIVNRSNRSYCTVFLKHVLKLDQKMYKRVSDLMYTETGPLRVYKKRGSSEFAVLYDSKERANLKRASYTEVKTALGRYKTHKLPRQDLIFDFGIYLQQFEEHQRLAVYGTVVLGVDTQEMVRKTLFSNDEVADLKQTFDSIPKPDTLDDAIINLRKMAQAIPSVVGSGVGAMVLAEFLRWVYKYNNEHGAFIIDLHTNPSGMLCSFWSSLKELGVGRSVLGFYKDYFDVLFRSYE